MTDLMTEEIPDPQYGGVDEAVIRDMLGAKDLQLAQATSHIAAQEKTIAALRARVAELTPQMGPQVLVAPAGEPKPVAANGKTRP